MLVDEHPYADATHVEPVQKVLYVVLGGGVHLDALFHLNHTLGHRLHHAAVTVPDLDQSLTETGRKNREDSVLRSTIDIDRQRN